MNDRDQATTWTETYLTQARAGRDRSGTATGDARPRPDTQPDPDADMDAHADADADATDQRDQADADAGSGRASGRGRGPSQATELVGLATERYDVAVTPAGEPFAVARDGYGPYIARMLRGGRNSLRAELAASFVAEHGRAPSSSALADTMLVLEGIASQRPPVPLALRTARADTDELVLDLGDVTGRAAVIGPERWHLTQRSPVLFRRTTLTAPLPEPQRGGTLQELRDLVNLTGEAWPMACAWLVAALIPDIPHPIALIGGEHGSGKSTAARNLTRLLDPSTAQLRTVSKDLETWAVAAAGSWTVALDNLSGVQPWLSDALCRAVTGDGLVRRRLYADDDLSVLAFRRVISMTTIHPGALRGDLADRIIAFDLERLSRRREEREHEAAYLTAWPRLLGALLDLAADVLAVLPTLAPLEDPPRLVDFARILAAVDALLGTSGVNTYRDQATRLATEVSDSDPLTQALRPFIDRERTWQGTAGELLAKLTAELPDGRRPHGWPDTPRGMAGALIRAAPTLRTLGYGVEQLPRAHGGRRPWWLSADQPRPASLLDDDSPDPAPPDSRRRE